MTHPEFDAKKLAEALNAHAETTGDFLDNIIAIKGRAYAAHLDAIAGILNVTRTTNTLICKEIPTFVVDMVADLQLDRITKLIEPFFYHQFPGDEPETVIKRHAACDEFQQNVTALVEQRMAVEQKLHVAIIPQVRKGDSGDTEF